MSAIWGYCLDISYRYYLYYSWLPLGLGLLMSHVIIKLHECYLEVVTENSKNDHIGLKKEGIFADNNVQRSIGDDCEDTAKLRVDTQLPVDKCIALQAHVDCETENKGNRGKNLEQLNVIIPICEILGQTTIVEEFGDVEQLCNLGVAECKHEGTKAVSSEKELKKGG